MLRLERPSRRFGAPGVDSESPWNIFVKNNDQRECDIVLQVKSRIKTIERRQGSSDAENNAVEPAVFFFC